MIDTSSDVPAVRVASMTRGTTATVPKSTPTTCTTPSAMVSVRSLALHRTPTPLCAQVEMASLQRPARPGDRRTCAEALGALSGRASTLTGHAGARACDRHYSRKRDATRGRRGVHQEPLPWEPVEDWLPGEHRNLWGGSQRRLSATRFLALRAARSASLPCDRTTVWVRQGGRQA